MKRIFKLEHTKWIVLLACLHSVYGLSGQKDTDWKFKRWTINGSMGLNAFQTDGIPMSRNQINYNSVHPGENSTYQQESRIAGFCYQVKVQYGVHSNGRLGLLLNGFKDDDEYLRSSDIRMNVEAIQADSLSKVTVLNMQSYLNLGLDYQHCIYRSNSGRHQFSANVGLGWSFNRTPDRTEFDYFDEFNFIVADTLGSNFWRQTHTDFRGGIFVSPGLDYEYCLGKGRGLHFSVCEFLQWHHTGKELKLLHVNSGGTGTTKSYSLRALQIKLGFSF